MQKVKGVIQHCDSLGAEYSFSYKRAPRHQSIFGAALTFLSYIIVAISSFILFKQYQDTTNVETSQSTHYSKSSPNINLAQNDFYPIVILYGRDDQMIMRWDAQRYVYIDAFIFDNELVSFADKTNRQKLVTSIRYIPCADLEDLTYYKKFYTGKENGVETLIEWGGLCPNITDFSDFNLVGTLTSRPHRYMVLGIKPCALPVREWCMPWEKVDRIRLSFVLPQYSVDAENYADPITMIPNIDDRYILSPFYLLKNNFKFSSVEIFDDRNELFFNEPKKKDGFFVIDESTFKTSLLGRVLVPGYELYCDIHFCFPYALFFFQSGNKVTKITRTYPTMVEVLGEVGRFLGVALVVSGVVYMIYSKREEVNLKREIFEPEKEMDKEVKKNRVFGYEKTNNGQKKEKDKAEAVDELLQESLNGMNLLSAMNSISVFSKAFFQQHDMRLIHLALKNYTIKRALQTEVKNNKFQNKILPLAKSDDNKTELQNKVRDLLNNLKNGSEPKNFQSSRLGLNLDREEQQSLFVQRRVQDPEPPAKNLMLEDIPESKEFGSMSTPVVGNQMRSQKRLLKMKGGLRPKQNPRRRKKKKKKDKNQVKTIHEDLERE